MYYNIVVNLSDHVSDWPMSSWCFTNLSERLPAHPSGCQKYYSVSWSLVWCSSSTSPHRHTDRSYHMVSCWDPCSQWSGRLWYDQWWSATVGPSSPGPVPQQSCSLWTDWGSRTVTLPAVWKACCISAGKCNNIILNRRSTMGNETIHLIIAHCWLTWAGAVCRRTNAICRQSKKYSAQSLWKNDPLKEKYLPFHLISEQRGGATWRRHARPSRVSPTLTATSGQQHHHTLSNNLSSNFCVIRFSTAWNETRPASLSGSPAFVWSARLHAGKSPCICILSQKAVETFIKYHDMAQHCFPPTICYTSAQHLEVLQHIYRGTARAIIAILISCPVNYGL